MDSRAIDKDARGYSHLKSRGGGGDMCPKTTGKRDKSCARKGER